MIPLFWKNALWMILQKKTQILKILFERISGMWGALPYQLGFTILITSSLALSWPYRKKIFLSPLKIRIFTSYGYYALKIRIFRLKGYHLTLPILFYYTSSSDPLLSNALASRALFSGVGFWMKEGYTYCQ